MLKRLLKRKRVGGGGYETIVVILLLILAAPVYIVLSWAMSNIDAWQAINYSTGYYDQDSNTFINNIWLWLPIIIFFLSIAYLLVRYQRRSPDDM